MQNASENELPKVWLIRNDVFDEKLETDQFISIGWDLIPDLDSIDLDHGTLAALLKAEAPNDSPQSLTMQASIIRRFHDEVLPGDIVVAPRKGTTLIRVGRVSGRYFHEASDEQHLHRIPVEWIITDLRRDLLPDAVRQGLRNISTLSQVRREPDFFRDLASAPHRLEEMLATPTDGQGTWLVGAHIDGEDRTQDFVSGGYWKLADGLDKRTAQMRPGDRIAIKATSTRRTDVPFDNRGLSVSYMEIKATTGVVFLHLYPCRVEVESRAQVHGRPGTVYLRW